jgi:hypothetical protein
MLHSMHVGIPESAMEIRMSHMIVYCSPWSNLLHMHFVGSNSKHMQRIYPSEFENHNDHSGYRVCLVPPLNNATKNRDHDFMKKFKTNFHL